MRAAAIALALVGCSRPWMTDESGRIDQVMAKDARPPEGITLGRDAPRMAPPFVERFYQPRRRYSGRGGYR